MAQARQEQYRLDRALQTPVGRRPLLKALAGAGVLSAVGMTSFLGKQRIVDPIQEQITTWKHIEGTQEEFLEKYSSKLARMRIGANICPDFRLFQHNVDPEQVMAFLADDMGCRDVRFGVRWSTFHTQGLEPYVPYFKAAERNGITLNTSIPSPKNPWWPEEHIPTEFVPYIPSDLVVRAGSPFANIALSAAENFFNDLEDNNIDPRSLDYCPVNECRDAWGRWGMRMDRSFMAQYGELLSQKAPGSVFLMNGSCFALDGPSPFRDCTNFALQFQQDYPDLQYAVGVDFYHQSEVYGVNSTIDTASAAAMWYGPGHIEETLSDIAQSGIKLEFTEVQKHIWGNGNLKYLPGTEYHMRYLLARLADEFVDTVPGVNTDNPYITRIWGYEEDIVRMLQDSRYVESNPVFSLLRNANALHLNSQNIPA